MSTLVEETKQILFTRSSLFKTLALGESMACLKNPNILKRRMEWQRQSVERHKKPWGRQKLSDNVSPCQPCWNIFHFYLRTMKSLVVLGNLEVRVSLSWSIWAHRGSLGGWVPIKIWIRAPKNSRKCRNHSYCIPLMLWLFVFSLHQRLLSASEYIYSPNFIINQRCFTKGLIPKKVEWDL